MGTTVIGGMLAASAIGTFFVPAIFVVVEKLSKARPMATTPAGSLPVHSPAPEPGDD